MTRGRVLALVVGSFLLGACATYVHKSDTIAVPRKALTQARGKVASIYHRVLALENAACRDKKLSAAQCRENASVDADWKKSEREIEALITVPDYEVDWAHVLTTLDRIGNILDKLPVP